VKFLVDMPLSPGLATWLGDHGHDATHAGYVGLARATDAVILACARTEQRVVVTADLDYPRLLAQTGAGGPGVVLLRGGNLSEREAIEYMERMFKAIPIGELPQSIMVIERMRIRRRRLPIEIGC